MGARGAQQAVIDAIEAMQPSTVYVEADDQGRLRVVRLERVATGPASGSGAARSVPDALAGAVETVAAEERKRVALERCLHALRGLVSTACSVAHDRVFTDLGREGGTLTEEQGRDRDERCDQRMTDAWALIRPALERLLDESGRQVSSLDTSGDPA